LCISRRPLLIAPHALCVRASPPLRHLKIVYLTYLADAPASRPPGLRFLRAKSFPFDVVSRSWVVVGAVSSGLRLFSVSPYLRHACFPVASPRVTRVRSFSPPPVCGRLSTGRPIQVEDQASEPLPLSSVIGPLSQTFLVCVCLTFYGKHFLLPLFYADRVCCVPARLSKYAK